MVIGKGSKKADIMFIGEGPGEQEDLQGVPFVGAAGQLLDKMLLAAGLDENDYYIAYLLHHLYQINDVNIIFEQSDGEIVRIQ